MAEEADTAPLIIARHASGRVKDPRKLDNLIAESWAALISDPEKRLEIARVLEVDAQQLDASRPPFVVKVEESGILVTTILILLAKGFVGGLGAAAGKATFDRLSALWRNDVSEPLQDPRTQAIGPARIEEEKQPSPKEDKRPSPKEGDIKSSD